MAIGYELIGRGPEHVIVFNDWLADCHSWQPMYPYVDQNRYTYAFADLRGYGRSLHLSGQYNEKESSDDAIVLADTLGWNQFHIVGFSMTGMVVERLVLDYPERVKSEIAIGPVSAAAVKMTQEERDFFLSTLADDDAVRELAARISAHRLTRQWSERKLELARTTRNNSAVVKYFDMWTTHDFSEEVKKRRPQTPLLVIAGEWDQQAFLEDRQRATFLAWHDNAELVVIRNCGHCPMQETPVYLATLLENFFEKHQ
jgi:pimeloyl-ACP methyl ester carboxylesterase